MAGAAGAAGTAGAAGAGADDAPVGAGAAGDPEAAGADVVPWGVPGAAAEAPAAAGVGLGKVSMTLRTTGVSIVEDADFTYSPIPLRWASRVLLSVPSSLASALTRTFATFLLSSVSPDRRETVLLLGLAHC